MIWKLKNNSLPYNYAIVQGRQKPSTTKQVETLDWQSVEKWPKGHLQAVAQSILPYTYSFGLEGESPYAPG